jgi:hypothetical protein
MPQQLRPCGTTAAYRRHLYAGETPCEKCVAAYRQEARELMAKRRNSPGPKPLHPCGTLGAHERHRRRGEDPCEPCRQARAAYMADYKSRTRTAVGRTA